MMNDPRSEGQQSAKATGSGWNDKPKSRGPSKELLAFVVVAVLAVVFVLGNTESASIRFLVPRVQAPMWVLVVLCIAIGIVLDRAWQFSRRRKKKRDDD
jgi:uncharacterized integral membrane protein